MGFNEKPILSFEIVINDLKFHYQNRINYRIKVTLQIRIHKNRKIIK